MQGTGEVFLNEVTFVEWLKGIHPSERREGRATGGGVVGEEVGMFEI